MTREEAYKALGVSRTAGRSKAEQLYRERCRKLRLQMVPGMPTTARQKAQAELARVDTAWQVLRAPGPATNTTGKPSTKRAARSSAANVVPHRTPQTLGEAWEQVASAMPFSEPVIAVVLILVLLVVILALVTHL